MTRHPIPAHAPLLPRPFCGREASVAAYRAAPDQPLTYSVGCWVEPDPFSHNPHWDDCLSPYSAWLADLDRTVKQWNRRAG